MSRFKDDIAQLAGTSEADLRQIERSCQAGIERAQEQRDATHAQLLSNLLAELLNGEHFDAADVEQVSCGMADADGELRRSRSALSYRFNVALNARLDARAAGSDPAKRRTDLAQLQRSLDAGDHVGIARAMGLDPQEDGKS